MPPSLPRRPDAGVPLVTVAIASYNGRHLLEVVLPSLARQSFRDFEVVVVDDSSSDDTVEWLAERWPEAQVVALERNGGVTAALNVCARAGRGELIALFNNDLEVHSDCLGELVAALRRYPEAGSAAAKLMNFHERDLIDGAGDVYTWAGVAGRRGHGERDEGQYDQPRAIFGACAGAALYRRTALQDVGYFDEDFYAVYEDVDWSLRAQLAGFACRYVPSAVVYHMESTTIGSDQSDFVRYQLWRNGMWVMVKGLPLGALARHAPRLILGQATKLGMALRDRKLGLLGRAWRDALRGMPDMLRKRRDIQGRRRIGVEQLDRLIGADGGAAESPGPGGDQCARRRIRSPISGG